MAAAVAAESLRNEFRWFEAWLMLLILLMLFVVADGLLRFCIVV